MPRLMMTPNGSSDADGGGGRSLGAASMPTSSGVAAARVFSPMREPPFGGVGRIDQIREARARGYEGDACGECGQFTLVRSGTCLKCVSCGATTGCS
ncbi:hypothetical protein CCP2SC5_170052 [Azospirillaceae bacterium]